MRIARRLAIGAAALALALSACTQSGGGSSNTPRPTIKIGSVSFNEAQVIAEMYAQVLEAAGYKVDRQLGIGTRDVTLPALESGKIDLQPEYLGGGTAHYDKSKASADPAATAQALQALVKPKGITVLAHSPGQDFDAFAVTKETAAQLKIAKMSDLAAVQDKLKWGLPPDCETNPVCKGALVDTYGITWPPASLKPLAACDVPIAEALKGGAINIAELCSTQAAISQYGFVILEDDKGSNPAQNVAPLVRDDYLARLSAAEKANFIKLIEAVSSKLTTEALQKVNITLNVDKKDVPDAAKAFLKVNGLLSA